MDTFTVENKGCIERADGVAQYVAEASSLGLLVGGWPEAIHVPGLDTFRRGEMVRDREGEVTHVRYTGTSWAVLTVWND
jgi:hypothetical protein